MALSVPKAPGVSQMLKDGARMYSGLEEAVYRNITACKEFAQCVKSAYGPNGMNKMVINHLEKQFVTSDAATIINELDVEHPAAKLMVLASQMQEHEVGDGTNFVIILAGTLLENAEELLRLGVTTSEIADGYKTALVKILQILPTLACETLDVIADKSEESPKVKDCIRTAIMSKQFGQEDFITDLVYRACCNIYTEFFNVDNIRVCKILGSSLLKSEIVNGMVFKRFVEGDVSSAAEAKIALYSCPVDIIQTETKGTVLIKSADELMKFSRGEENLLEQQIKAIADTGCKVIVAGAKFGDMALHYCNKYGIMAVRLNSKFDLRRLSKAVNGIVLPRLTAPTQEELGYCDSVVVEELGDTGIVAFRNEGKNRIATIVIRGATDNFMDDIERAINDGVNTFKTLTKDGRIVVGGGCLEIALATQLNSYAGTLPGLDQYAVRKFAMALEVFPKALAENSGVNGTHLLEKLFHAHQNENEKSFEGFDIESEQAATVNCYDRSIYDTYAGKMWGIKYAVEAATTILKVDQIIMAKRAGGPKVRAPGPDQDDD